MTADPSVARSPAATPGEARIPGLDGLRGIAILLVVAYHFNNDFFPMARSLPDRTLVRLLDAGWSGVDLFFVLSGFLITGILWDAKGCQKYFRIFYARRFFRIFPLYYGYLLVYFHALLPWLGLQPRVLDGVAQATPWYWLYLTNVLIAVRGPTAPPAAAFHFWSLAIEEQFYLLWPLVVFFLSRTALLRVCGVAVAVAIGLRIGAVALGISGVSAYVLLPTRMDALLIGAALALAARGPGGLQAWQRFMRPTAWCAGILLAISLLITRDADSVTLPMRTVGYTAVAVLYAAVITAVVTRPERSLTRALDHGILRFLGRYSYALYVFHPFLIMLLEAAGLNRHWAAQKHLSLTAATVLLLPVYLAAAAAVAFASWHLFEKHFLRLKAYFSYRPSVSVRHASASATPLTQ